jgi:uroporphyrinogen-III synthase
VHTGVVDGIAMRSPPRVAVTRPLEGAAELAQRLLAAGAQPIVLPLTRIEFSHPRELRAVVRSLSAADWVIITSANAVRALATISSGPDASRQHRFRVAAVGRSTATAIERQLGWNVTVVPSTFTGADLVAAMLATGSLHERRVVWPRARDARPAVARALEDAGARLDAPVVYAAEPETAHAHELVALIRAGAIDVVTFTAPSAIQSFSAAGEIPAAVYAVLGSSTADAARAHGLPVHIQPGEHTLAALADAVLAYWAGRSRDV